MLSLMIVYGAKHYQCHGIGKMGVGGRWSGESLAILDLQGPSSSELL